MSGVILRILELARSDFHYCKVRVVEVDIGVSRKTACIVISVGLMPDKLDTSLIAYLDDFTD